MPAPAPPWAAPPSAVHPAPTHPTINPRCHLCTQHLLGSASTPNAATQSALFSAACSSKTLPGLCVKLNTQAGRQLCSQQCKQLRVTLGGFSSSLTLRPSTCTSVTLSPSLRKSVQVMTYAYLHGAAAKHWCRCFAYRTPVAYVQPESAILGVARAALQTTLELGG